MQQIHKKEGASLSGIRDTFTHTEYWMEVHQFSSKIGKCKGFYHYNLSSHSSVPGVLGQMSIEQHSQTA